MNLDYENNSSEPDFDSIKSFSDSTEERIRLYNENKSPPILSPPRDQPFNWSHPIDLSALLKQKPSSMVGNIIKNYL